MSGTEDPIAHRIRDAGWQQGDLLPALSWSVNFLPGSPATNLSQAAEHAEQHHSSDGITPHGLAVGLLAEGESFAILTQTCDLLKRVATEPTVMLLRAFHTTNKSILREASTNSVRYFLLNPEKGIVVDATVPSTIEKPLLASLPRVQGPPDQQTRERFSRWAGRRFGRPALPDPIVRNVTGPIAQRLRDLRRQDDPLVGCLSYVEDIRIARLAPQPPYDVQLLFIVPEQERESIILDLARLVREMQSWLPTGAEIVAWDAFDLHQISAGDFRSTDGIYLEDLTYEGGEIVGTGPDVSDDPALP